MADQARPKRFLQGARAASSLNHPHIVTIHEIDAAADGIDFLVMEYVPGQTLDGLIPKGGMPVPEALRLAVQVADAVAAAHAKGIVHRDLKPANVIVTRDGGVKVLDFGLAKLVTDDRGDGGLTQSTASASEALRHPGAITGTAGYMSPEQATGHCVAVHTGGEPHGVRDPIPTRGRLLVRPRSSPWVDTCRRGCGHRTCCRCGPPRARTCRP